MISIHIERIGLTLLLLTAMSGAVLRGQEPDDGLPPAGGASGVRPASGGPALPTEGRNQIKIFTLQNADASAIVSILDHFFDAVNFAADHRTNSVIAEGAEGALANVEALLARLDEQPSHENAGGAFLRGDAMPVTAGPAAKESNQQTLQTAQRYRRLEADGGEKRQLDELKKKLRGEVAVAFQARQDSQRAELAQLAERMRGIEQMIAARDKIRDRIIERRVEELLNPAIDWPESAAPGAATPRPGMSSGVPGALPSPDDGGIMPTGVSSAGSPGPPGAAPAAASSDLLVLRRSAALARERLERVRSLAESGRATRADLGEAEAGVAVAEAELAAAEQRFETEGRLLALDVRKAKSDLETATKELKRTEELTGVVAGGKIDELRKAVVEAQFALERAEIRLNAHLAAAEPGAVVTGTLGVGGTPGVGAPLRATDRPGAVVVDAPTTISGDLQVLRSKVAAAEAKLKRLAQLGEAGETTLAEVNEAKAGVAVARAELAAAERRYQEQTRLLELDRKEAKENLTAAQRELKEMEQAYRANAVSAVEFTRVRNRAMQAEFAVERAEIRLQAHHAAAGDSGDGDSSHDDLEKSDSNDGAAAAQSSPAAAEATVDSVAVHFVVQGQDKQRQGAFDVQVEKDGLQIVKKEGWGGGEVWKEASPDDPDHTFTMDVKESIPPTGRYLLKSRLKGKDVGAWGAYYLEVVDSTGKVHKSPLSTRVKHNSDDTQIVVELDIP